nr:hypothetical protein [Candidatus Dependentiae bacterium]
MKRFVGACLLFLSVNLVMKPDDFFNTPPISESFINRWGFQKICKFVFDPRVKHGVYPTKEGEKTFDPAAVQPADILFVRDVNRFFREMHPFIRVPYIMVTHGEHLEAVTKEHLLYLDDPKVIAWFAIHACEETHPKFYPIPLGVLQKPWIYKASSRFNKLFTELRKNTVKKYLLYMNFADSKKPERKVVKATFEGKSYCKNGTRKPFRGYLKEMSECKFVLS